MRPPWGSFCQITLTSCFNNEINFLFSCEICSWSLHFHQFDMSSKWSTRQHISAQYCAKQMSKIWWKNIQAFLRYSNYRVGIFYFASPCTVTNNCRYFTKWFEHIVWISIKWYHAKKSVNCLQQNKFCNDQHISNNKHIFFKHSKQMTFCR